MTFNDSKPIYLQICELISNKILSLTWREGERIPSVRELGAELEVNPNTVMRAYEWLAERGVIYNRRGIGFFVSSEAKGIVTQQQRSILFESTLHEVARQMRLLGVSVEEVRVVLERLLERP
ncbi:MAG: GntR family transcriptional regulator [Rikenellaceae bacterium]